jgi:hypothetical protein
MDNRTVAINNLRILNDYVSQTIEALMLASRVGLGQFGVSGLSHTPFTAISPFGASAFGMGPTAVSPHLGAALRPFGVTGSIAPSFGSVIDPFLVQRGLSHTGFGTGLGTGFGAAWGTPSWMPVTQLLGGQLAPWGVPVI